MQLVGPVAVSYRNDKRNVEEEVFPVSFPCVVEISHKLAEFDEEGVEDPEEGEESPSGVGSRRGRRSNVIRKLP